MAIPICGDISIDEADLHEEFIRSSGAGGQNVNRVATAVQLRLLSTGVDKLPHHVRTKLLAIAGQRATKAGEIIISAQRHRTQERNRADALARLISLLQEAAHRDPYRVATRPTRASKTRRLEAKRRQSSTKKGRSKALPE
ncbi:MAG: alternative ribosome rescue aminoacyl-tRNA hydrolase ArfB [Beijerinckiaceae bacterium]|nr:alternative ribosome rescue aminoacyl-tRNA hydrolase ArfB [Beijerinckiaceae bacterium]